MYLIYLIIITAVITLDRITKALAVSHLSTIDTYPLINGVLHLTYTENTGAAFSIFKGKASYLAIFSVAVVAVIIFLFIFQIKKNKSCILYLSSIAMIIGGAIGNMIDRFKLGYVVDFVDFRLINFAIFNVADVFLTVGTIILCLCLLFDKRIKL